jgi:hypothetical protein
MITNTTFRCTKKEADKIKKAAFKKGMFFSGFVNYALNENLPINKVITNKKIIHAVFLGVRIPDLLQDKIEESQKVLSSEIEKIKKGEIILYCALLQCEKEKNKKQK